MVSVHDEYKGSRLYDVETSPYPLGKRQFKREVPSVDHDQLRGKLLAVLDGWKIAVEEMDHDPDKDDPPDKLLAELPADRVVDNRNATEFQDWSLWYNKGHMNSAGASIYSQIVAPHLAALF